MVTQQAAAIYQQQLTMYHENVLYLGIRINF